MPDVINTEVDGVEPSIPVLLLDISGNPERVKLFTDDNGTERFLVKGSDEPYLVTPQDLSILGGVGIEISNKNEAEDEPDKPEETQAQNPPVVKPLSPVNPPITPGQTGQ